MALKSAPPIAAAATVLVPFDGLPVLGVGIAITNAGDGLSDAVKVDPIVMHHGETVFVVIECKVTKVTHVEVEKDDPTVGLRRVHTLRAGTATIVDAELVEGHLDEQRLRIKAAKDREAGAERLPGVDPELDKIDSNYDDGLDDEPEQME